MEKTIENLNQLLGTLQRLLSLHRRLLDAIRTEREALLSADVRRIHDVTLEKQGVLHEIQVAEQERVNAARTVAALLNAPADGAGLSNLILLAQAASLRISDQLRSVQQALQLLVSRIQEQNQANLRLVETSLVHVNEMKKNIIGESMPASGTYSSSGQKQNSPAQPRMLSTEV